MPDAITFDHDQLRQYLEAYRNDLPKIWDAEKYKWESVTHFQQNWNPNAPDFAAMLEQALPGNNLLASARYFPKGMITFLAREFPEKIRNAFATLYNDSISLSERVDSFRKISDDLLLNLKPDKIFHLHKGVIEEKNLL